VVIVNQSSQKPINTLIGHEVAHRVASRRPDLFQRISTAIEQDALPARMEKMKQEIYQKYEKAGIEHSPERLQEEVVARYSEELFQDPSIMNEIAAVEPSLAARFVQYVGDIIDSIKKYNLVIRCSTFLSINQDRIGTLKYNTAGV